MTDQTTPALADPPIHQCPRPGSAIMPCCGRTPFEVPRVDGLTTESYMVTCGELTDEDWQVWHAIHGARARTGFVRAAEELRAAFEGLAIPFGAEYHERLRRLQTLAAERLLTKAQRNAARKAQRNAAEYSQPWAPGVITRKSRKR